jgi:hypothetical protein
MRFLASKTGTVHVVDRSPSDPGTSSCPVVSRALNAGTWKGQRSLKPEDVLKMKDCTNCESFKLASQAVAAKSEPVAPKAPSRRRHRESPVSKIKKQTRNKERNVTTEVRSDNHPVADERTTQKAKEHVAIAEEHGWSVQVTSNPRRGLTIVASRGDEICVLAYRENGILWNEEIVFKVPGRSVPMHNSGTWRRQVSLPEGQRPIAARPKKFGRKPQSKVASGPEDAEEPTADTPEINGEIIPINKSSLPFPVDADDAEIIEHIKGRTLYWRNDMLSKVVWAQVPIKARMIRFGHTGRAQRRYVSFPESYMTKDGEVYGPERCVAVEAMLRVR